jgi:phage-related protein
LRDIFNVIYSAVVEEPDPARPAAIHWEGDSKEVLSGFPAEVKSTFGFSLRQIQNGRQPRCEHRPMTSVGRGVWELKDGDSRTWYRVMYMARIKNVIHVLHCFEKDSRKTDRRDVQVAKARLSEVLKRLREQGAVPHESQESAG